MEMSHADVALPTVHASRCRKCLGFLVCGLYRNSYALRFGNIPLYITDI